MKKVLIVDDVKGWRDFNSNAVDEFYNGEVEITTADCAQKAYDLLLENRNQPFDVIITDLQMESTYAPKMAGEWLVEQIKADNRYMNTKVVIISATYNIRHTAEMLGVSCIPKSTALKCFSAYEEILPD